MAIYNVIGIMSGTSLDGLDIAFCTISTEDYSYTIIHAETINYNDDWKQRLSGLMNDTAFSLALTNIEYGEYIGNCINEFIIKHKLKPEFIASHGHTIFHQPKKKLTLQIGSGTSIFAITGIPVIYDFRLMDIALGGNGAPLVPIGDELLFSQYDYCINLGGFANISYKELNKNQRIAFDICAVNVILNKLIKEIDESLDYDDRGEHARSGNINVDLLQALNQLPYYQEEYPKSLGIEWVNTNIIPLLTDSNIPVREKIATYTEHIAIQIANQLNDSTKSTALITGGGAFNTFLIESIQSKTSVRLIIPDSLTINYKEALIFAFLGVLKMENKSNCFKTVTGAIRDSISGILIN